MSDTYSKAALEALNAFIAEGNGSHLQTRNNKAGVLIKGEDEPKNGTWIALSNLGYNKEIGFFEKSKFPNEPSV